MLFLIAALPPDRGEAEEIELRKRMYDDPGGDDDGGKT